MEAWLGVRDRLIAALDATDLAILRGLVEGRTQTEIARELDLDPAAITRRKHQRGIDALRVAYRAFDGLAVTTTAPNAPTATASEIRPRRKRR